MSKETSVITLSAGQVVTTIALYVLSRRKNELVPHCHYLVKGVLARAIKEQLSFGASVAEFLNGEEWAYKKLILTNEVEPVAPHVHPAQARSKFDPEALVKEFLNRNE